MLTFDQVNNHAKALGMVVVEDHAGAAQGFWIEDKATGEGPWEDGNFSTSLEEVAGKLCALEVQRGWKEYHAHAVTTGIDLHVRIAPGQDLDRSFVAYCLDEREMISINGWLWEFEEVNA